MGGGKCPGEIPARGFLVSSRRRPSGAHPRSDEIRDSEGQARAVACCARRGRIRASVSLIPGESVWQGSTRSTWPRKFLEARRIGEVPVQRLPVSWAVISILPKKADPDWDSRWTCQTSSQ